MSTDLVCNTVYVFQTTVCIYYIGLLKKPVLSSVSYPPHASDVATLAFLTLFHPIPQAKTNVAAAAAAAR